MKRTALIKLVEARLARPDLENGDFIKLVDQLGLLTGWIARHYVAKDNQHARGFSHAQRRIIAHETREEVQRMSLSEVMQARMQAAPAGVSNDAWRRMLRARIKELSNQQQPVTAQENSNV
jgi:hypothetical protein